MKTDGEINRTMQNCPEFLNYKMNIMECEGLQTVQNNAILQWHTRTTDTQDLYKEKQMQVPRHGYELFFKVLWEKQEGIE